MEISSKFHAQPGKVQLVVLDVTANEKPFIAGLLIGNLRADPPSASEVGNECLRRLIASQDASSSNDQVHMVEVRSPDRAQAQLMKVAASVGRHDAVAFFCLDEATYEAMFSALNIRT
jgi:hypothetical protein